MRYISTRNTKKTYSFKDVFLKGLAPDGGLFIPKKIPSLSKTELKKMKKFSFRKLAIEIISKFCGEEFSKKEIKSLVNISYRNFRVKDVVAIKKIGKENLLELFHGPTLAFKDIAMQVMGNMYESILKKNNLKLNVVVATSGDTGAAAINAIKDRKNMNIFILHPHKKISEVQRKFMTTVNSKNIFNISLTGNFDDCQKIVKLMFADKKFCKSINMTGVNSINWIRIIIQVVYYFFSYLKVDKNNKKINFSVPTGNFGNIYAGYLAKKMGLPINKLIIATNKNDILKRVLNNGVYKPMKVKQTLSPSMDIQVASNFERLIFDVCAKDSIKTAKLMQQLYDKGKFKLNKKELDKIKKIFNSESLSDKEIKMVIKKIYKEQNILIDPHTAIGVGVLKKLSIKGKTIILSTAHPSKFSTVVKNAINVIPKLPAGLKNILNKKEKYKRLPKDIKIVKNYISERVKYN